MAESRPLTLHATHQGEPPNVVKLHLGVTETYRLFPLTVAESRAMADLLVAAGGKAGLAIVWTTADDPLFDTFLGQARVCPGSVPGPDGDGERGRPHRQYVCFREAGESLAVALRTAWNAYEDLRFCPADSDDPEELEAIAESDGSEANEAAVGLDWQNRWYFGKKSGCLAVVGSLFGTLHFLGRLILSPGYREKLTDPFEQAGTIALTLEHGAMAFKGGHDEVIFLELYTTSVDIMARAEAIFAEHGIPLELEEEVRERG